jgi:methionyl-tRNA formyltransferase
LVNTLINGDTRIGVTALFASKEYDKGDIIDQKFTEIQYPIKISSAIEIVSNLYVTQCSDIVQQIIQSEPILSHPQNEKEATYSLWRNEDDYEINWSYDAEYIQRFIDAVGFPFRGASTFFDHQKIRILDASCVHDVTICNRDVGKVIFFENGFPVVVCGKGLLKINEAIYDKDQSSLFPLIKFRIKFAQS